MRIVLHVNPSIYAFQLEIHEVCLVLNSRVGKKKTFSRLRAARAKTTTQETM